MTDADVIVVGSGAAGMTAAITAAILGCRVVLLEKSDEIGGTTAWSGGAAWVPGNPHMQSVAITDSTEAAAIYVRQVMGKSFDPVMVTAFLNSAPRMISFLESRTSAVRFQSYLGSDYHPEFEGAAPRARTLM